MVSLIAYITMLVFSKANVLPISKKMIRASETMKNVILLIRGHCNKSGIKIDHSMDPNRTGLIGPSHSSVTTTKGNLEAKRTTTNPNMAGLIVYLLTKAGVQKGDRIAVSSSGSFPALLIASLAAADVMELKPVIIISAGSSSYGANRMGFNLLDIFLLLQKKRIFSFQLAAVSLGGEKDIGMEWEPEIREKLIKQINDSKIPFIYELDLNRSVQKRKEIYGEHSEGKKISAFINNGGGEASLGTNNLILKVKPGLNFKIPEIPKEQWGIIHEMSEQNIPIIHLLYIKGLVQKYDLPWDPVPLPEPDEMQIADIESSPPTSFWVVFFIYFFVMVLLLFSVKIKPILFR